MAILPKVKLKALLTFPATVNGGTGIDVTRANGGVSVDLDYSEFGQVSTLPANPNLYSLVYDTSLNNYRLAPISLFGAGAGGLADAPIDGFQYGRQSGAWTLTSDGSWVATDKQIYVSTSGNDAHSGLSPPAAKLTLQAAVNAANPNGTVYVGSGTFTLTSTLAMQPGVRIIGSSGTIITQGSATNLNPLISFQTNAANDAAIRGCIVDGNRAANTDNNTRNMIYIGTANDVTLENNKFRNFGGSCVNVSEGLRPVVRSNDFQNVMHICLVASSALSGAATYGKFNGNTFSNNLGQHVVYIAKSHGNQILDNIILATQLIGTCNVSGTAVTWVSGTNFAGLLPGGFCITSPGGTFNEGYIVAVNSSTSLTLQSAGTTGTGTPFVIGTGDLINVGNSVGTRIAGNRIAYGASGGIVLHNFYGGPNLSETVVQGNIVNYAGGSGIAVQSTSTAPVTFASDTTIQNNQIYSCGMGGAAVGAQGKNAIGLTDFAPTTLGSCIISGNRMQNEGGFATMDWGIYLNGVSAGQVYAGNNTCIGITNAGIRNGITVTPGPKFGSAPTVTNLRTHGGQMAFNITPGGTGIAANPTVSVTTIASSLTQPPAFLAKAYDGNGTSLTVLGDIENTASSTGFTFTLVGAISSGLVVAFGVVGT